MLIFSKVISADSFNYNSFNNHGTLGLINMPSARFYDEEVHGITVYDGTPDQKITMTSSPYDWLEASFFYTNIQGRPYCSVPSDPVCKQDYKDKGFNVKLRLKEEGKWPALAVGIYDIAGTGLYSSEYIVGSYGINKTDFHFGLGWGLLNGLDTNFKNPFGYLNDSFNFRPADYEGNGGQFQLDRYFSENTVSPFFGVSHSINDKVLIKFERDSTLTPGKVGHGVSKNDYSFGFEYNINSNFTIGFSRERGSYSSIRFIYKNNPKRTLKKYKYQEAKVENNDSKYEKLTKNLENNGIGVEKIYETSRSIGLELTQFIHPDIYIIEEIITQASIDAGINKNIKKDLKIADLEAISEIDDSFMKNAETIYAKKKTRGFNTSNVVRFRPFLASREEFFKGALLAENDTEFIIRNNLFFNTNLKYSLWNNFEDLNLPPKTVFPAQVRSDVKNYLRNMNDGILIGRAQLDFYITPKRNNHFMFTGGILEDMFSGVGFEYLYFKQNTNYAFGFEVFNVHKRDYKWGFGRLNYQNTIATANLYYRNYGSIPFDMKVSAGEYLAGDEGMSIELSRSYRNGVRFGVFATITDVTSGQFGEGSFDKGIFFNIPIYGNLINYTWRPLTKDPGAKLNRRNTLHDLLVKFRPIN